MPTVEKARIRTWPLWLLAGILIGALLPGRAAEIARAPDAAWAQADGRPPQSRPGRTPFERPSDAAREPTFEEEMARLHPSRTAEGSTEVAMCGRGGSGSGSGCCCAGRMTKTAASGSGSGLGAGSSSGAEAAGQCRAGGCGGSGMR